MIEFKNPPTGRSRGASQETLDIIAALQTRPNEWALIKRDASVGTVSHWNKRPGLEAKGVTSGKAKGKSDIYARWVGVE